MQGPHRLFKNVPVGAKTKISTPGGSKGLNPFQALSNLFLFIIMAHVEQFANTIEN